MELRKCSGLLACTALLALALLSGCGSSSTTAIPSTATIFYSHSLIFGNNSTPMTLGYNGFGQLGDGTLTTRAVAAVVPGLGHMQGGATGAEHTLVFGNSSSVMAWGYNLYGQLGNAAVSTTGTNAYSSTPVKVSGLHGIVTNVAAGAFHSLAVVNGSVYGWGYNGFGQVGDGTFINAVTPVPVKNGPDGTTILGSPQAPVTQVAAGGNHSLALTALDGTADGGGRVYAWGNNAYGQLGSSPLNPVNGLYSSTPALVNDAAGSPLSKVVQIAAAGSNSYALKSDGTVWAWGYNGMGQLGLDPSLPANLFSFIPVQISFDPALIGTAGIVRISAGTDHVLALLSDGTVVAWGFNNVGQVGNNDISAPPNSVTDHTRIFKPVKVFIGGNATPGSGAQMTGVTDLIAFGNHSLAKVGGIWYGWGDNGFGQLGNPISTSSIGYLLIPQLVQGF